MAHLDHNSSFQKWVLTDEEKIQGSVLTILQKQVIQNQITEAAEEKIALVYDLNKPMEFVQREAELQGRILCLKFLIETSNNAEEILRSTPQE